MKRLLFRLGMVLGCVVFFAEAVYAQSEDEGVIEEIKEWTDSTTGHVWSYVVRENGVGIVGLTLPTEEVTKEDETTVDCPILPEVLTVPATIENKPVMAISGVISWDVSDTFYEAYGDAAYDEMEALKTLTIPVTVTQIVESFIDIQPVTVTAPFLPWRIGRERLEEVTIPDGVKFIQNNAFDWCSVLTKVTIPESVIGIGNSAFTGASSLTSVTLPSKLEILGPNAFSESGLTSVTVPGSVKWVGYNVFQRSSNLTSVTFEEGITEIGWAICAGCENLTTVSLPSTLKRIGTDAFRNCPKLNPLTLPSGLITLGECALASGEDIRSLSDEDTPYYFDENNVCYESSAKEVLIAVPEVITEEGEEPYVYTIPDSVRFIQTSAFPATYAGYTNEADGAIYESSEMKVLLRAPSEATMFTVPDSVRYIADAAFQNRENDQVYDNEYLETVTIPEGVKFIGAGAFYRCVKLTEVALPSTLPVVGANAFGFCEALKTVTLAEGTKAIEDGAFSGCSALETITIPESMVLYGSETFAGCEKLTAISIPETMTVIPDGCFRDCQALEAIELPAGLVYIGMGAFQRLYKLNTLTLPEGLRWVDDSAFSECSWCTKNEILEPTEDCSEGCTGIATLRVPKSVLALGGMAFAFCDHLLAVTFDGTPVTRMMDSSIFYAMNNYGEMKGFYQSEYATEWAFAINEWGFWDDLLMAKEGAETETFTLTVITHGEGEVSGAGEYESGTEVELVATPADGYEFTGWSGDVTSTDNPLTVTVAEADMTLFATFTYISELTFSDPTVSVTLEQAPAVEDWLKNVVHQETATVTFGEGTTVESLEAARILGIEPIVNEKNGEVVVEAESTFEISEFVLDGPAINLTATVAVENGKLPNTLRLAGIPKVLVSDEIGTSWTKLRPQIELERVSDTEAKLKVSIDTSAYKFYRMIVE